MKSKISPLVQLTEIMQSSKMQISLQVASLLPGGGVAASDQRQDTLGDLHLTHTIHTHTFSLMPPQHNNLIMDGECPFICHMLSIYNTPAILNQSQINFSAH